MGKKKGIKISKVKRSNHLRNKVANRGKFKRNKGKAYKIYHPQNPKPIEDENQGEEENTGEEMLEMMDDDDAVFLQNAAKTQSYDIFKRLRVPNIVKKKRGHGSNDHTENDDKLERFYEEEMDQPDAKRTKLLLPIKTKHGVIMRSMEVDAQEEERRELDRQIKEQQKVEEKKNKKKKKKGGGKLEEEDENNEEKEEQDELETFQDESEQVVPESVATVDLLAFREELIRKRKFQIGLLAAGLLEDPENKVRNFKFLLDIMDSDHSEVKLTVRKLAALSLLEVFRDLLPSYQIKHQETRSGEKTKKATLQLQNYEKSLLKAYKMYLQSLEKMAKALRRKRGDNTPHDPKKEKLGLVAVRCMSELLIRHPYFNFAPNIGQALVQFLDNRNRTVREIVCKGLRTVLKEDKRGDVSLHIIRRINYVVRTRNHSVQPELLSVLLALRLRDINLDAEKEAELKEKQLKNRKHKILNASRRERKRQKRLEDIEKEMLETKAAESKLSKHKNLTEVTKCVFTIFFRVLKCAPSSKLLSVTLEGLAKFAHCINLEFFQDIVNVLDHLLLEEKLGVREQLHCVETVFTILSGQGEALNIDPLRFYSHLYRSLLEVHGGRTNPHASITLRALEKAVLQRRRKMSLQRLLAFTKRLSNLAPHLLHGTALGYLAVIRNILMQTRACEILLDTDSTHGDGIYQPELPEPEYCGAGASVLWEMSLLKRHYHPDVRRMAESITKGKEYALPPEISKFSPTVLAETYDSNLMVFRPAVPPPKKSAPRAFKGQLTLTSEDFTVYLQNVDESVKFESLQDWTLPEIKVENVIS